MYGIYSRAQVEFEYHKEIGQDGKNSKAYLAHDKYLDAELGRLQELSATRLLN